jgi:anti-anti-sigma factor
VRIQRDRVGDVPVLVVAGRLGSHGAHELERALIEVEPPAGCGVVLDLAGVDYMSSTALAALQAMDLFLRLSGGRLVLCHVDDAVRVGLELAGLVDLVEFAPTRDEAVVRASPPLPHPPSD